MSKTLEIIRESVHKKHRQRNEAIKRILARHKQGMINQSVANQQLKSCGHPGLKMEEIIEEDWRVDNPTPKEHVVFHHNDEVGHIRNVSGNFEGHHYPTGKKFSTGTLGNAVKNMQRIHSKHVVYESEDHHGFVPNQIYKRKHQGELKDIRYLGPHHNKEYAKIISHEGKKVTEKWENLIKESLSVNATSSDYVDDFVHSKNKMFKGDSKKERIKRALGAYYSKHRSRTRASED